jgi:hypothetical protein
VRAALRESQEPAAAPHGYASQPVQPSQAPDDGGGDAHMAAPEEEEAEAAAAAAREVGAPHTPHSQHELPASQPLHAAPSVADTHAVLRAMPLAAQAAWVDVGGRVACLVDDTSAEHATGVLLAVALQLVGEPSVAPEDHALLPALLTRALRCVACGAAARCGCEADRAQSRDVARRAAWRAALRRAGLAPLPPAPPARTDRADVLLPWCADVLRAGADRLAALPPGSALRTFANEVLSSYGDDAFPLGLLTPGPGVTWLLRSGAARDADALTRVRTVGRMRRALRCRGVERDACCAEDAPRALEDDINAALWRRMRALATGGLDEAQKRVASSRHDAPCLVAAGPGAGKTRVLVARCAHLCAQEGGGVPPRRVCALTFTRRAAGELAARFAAAGLLPPHVATLSSFVASFVGDVWRAAGRPAPLLMPVTARDAADTSWGDDIHAASAASATIESIVKSALTHVCANVVPRAPSRLNATESAELATALTECVAGTLRGAEGAATWHVPLCDALAKRVLHALIAHRPRGRTDVRETAVAARLLTRRQGRAGRAEVLYSVDDDGVNVMTLRRVLAFVAGVLAQRPPGAASHTVPLSVRLGAADAARMAAALVRAALTLNDDDNDDTAAAPEGIPPWAVDAAMRRGARRVMFAPDAPSHFLLDELQDSEAAHFELIALLSAACRVPNPGAHAPPRGCLQLHEARLTAVGDADQSICALHVNACAACLLRVFVCRC